MGTMMWSLSNYDSALYFYQKALTSLAQLPRNDKNNFYRPSIIQNNMAGLYGAKGQIKEGIDAMQKSIDNTQKFLASPNKNAKKPSATLGLYEAIDNLAGLYKDYGDYKRAGELLKYSYQQKKIQLPANHPAIFISEILLGQHYNDLYQYKDALKILDSAIVKVEKAEGDFLFWKADAYYAQALAYENLNKTEKALHSYQKSEALYEDSYQGDYDNIYLQFLRNLSTFYAKNNQYTQAINLANRSVTYIQKNQGAESLAYFYEILNLAQLSFIAQKNEAALQYANKAINVLNQQIKQAKYFTDTVKVELFKPKAILLQQQALYNLQPKKDSAFLKTMSTALSAAFEVLKRRRSILSDDESIAILMAENESLLNFSKKIEVELYQLTNNTGHLEKFLNIYETALHNRLRSRIDKINLIHFSGVPLKVFEEEQTLSKAITNSLQSTSHSSDFNSYQKATEQWNLFLNKIKIKYPAYYSLRYGFPQISIESLQKKLYPNSTTIRYFMVDSQWYVLRIDKNNFDFKKIEGHSLTTDIEQLLASNNENKFNGPLLFKLYNQLWKPIAGNIKTANINIIPESVLYSLSFDLLTPKLQNSYKDLIKNSVLSSYNLSYQYSLIPISNATPSASFTENYIAFIPEFNNHSRQKYQQAVSNALLLDADYINLLSQPHILQVSKEINDELQGKIISNEKATVASFKAQASNHKIIHIGTHAQYNNLQPQKSRLIFSKNENNYSESNYLYLEDIYSCKTASDLTILTACESGRAGFKDGEGMLSMAHAFTYSGSKRILTSLFKADEKQRAKY